MEKKLRRKFISITMCVVFIILFIIVLVINLIVYANIDTKAESVIKLMESNHGVMPEDYNQFMAGYGESAYSIRYFSVLFTDDGAIVDISNFRSITVDESIAIASSLKNDSGIYGDYKYQVLEIDGNTMVVFVDCSSEILMFQTALMASLYIMIIALVGVFVLTVIFSKRAVEPFVANNENQKKFITNISHELKTPLAIIKADTEILEMQHGESEWSGDIHKQITGLNNLVMYLIRLSKMEETENITKEKFDLSKMINDNCDNIAVLSNNKITRDIKDGVTIFGDVQLYKILVSILLENAAKYTTGDMSVFLDSKCIKIVNQCDGLKICSYDKWFYRFYKEDSSRNVSSSFGIGLSMAKTIVEKHGGNISCYSDDGENITLKISL